MTAALAADGIIEDAGDASASDDEAPATNHRTKAAEPTSKEAIKNTASEDATMVNRSDAPTPLAPQTGAEFAAEAKQRKLEKKRGDFTHQKLSILPALAGMQPLQTMTGKITRKPSIPSNVVEHVFKLGLTL